MAYRVKISTYVDGHLADLGYYRNWNSDHIFYEAFALAAYFHECKTLTEYLIKSTGQKNAKPTAAWGYHENWMKELEYSGDWLIYIDLTKKWIYTKDPTPSSKKTKDLPFANHEMKNFGYEYYYKRKSDGHIFSDYMMHCIAYPKPDFSKYERIKKVIPAKDITPENMYDVLLYCRISYQDVDMKKVLQMYQTDRDLQRHLSIQTRDMIMRDIDKQK